MTVSDAAIKFEALPAADLVVDAVYESGLKRLATDQRHWNDPLPHLLGVKASGGFRWTGKGQPKLVVLYTDLSQVDWPDSLDRETGAFTYYGDNRQPGKELHSKQGNKLLCDWFTATHETPPRRDEIPLIFVFSKAVRGKDVAFRGLAVPGHPGVSPGEDLAAVWRSKRDKRFQNYRAVFTILDIATVPRSWIQAAAAGERLGPDAPPAYVDWVGSGRYRPLRAEPATRVRSKEEQLPTLAADRKALAAIHGHFSGHPHAFEQLAADVVRMMDKNVLDIDLTRPSRDGGRDALGKYRIGPPSSAVNVEFAVEAKCYEPGKHSVGVKGLARLISRLRHRQFGVLVTTSFVAKQAYEEIIDDEHPVVIISGVDILEILAPVAKGFGEIQDHLRLNYPADGP